MSAFNQKTRSLGIRAGILAGASAAVLAVFGMGAGSAVAAPTCPGGTIAGQGSTLQKIAQGVWTGKYNSDCGAGTSVSYTGTGSGAGLKAMGYQGGSIETATTQYAGTDEAPEKSQIEVAEKLAKGNTVIAPVTQTAIAVVIHPPTGCSFESETGITWAQLNKVFGGTTITNWNQLGMTGGESCNHAITRVVRKDGSGTTYQFKNYLATLEETTGIKAETLPCETAGSKTWAGLRKNNGKTKAEGNPNLNWPECGTHSTVVAVEGGGGVAKTVAENVGDIGYAALPDAKGKSASVAELQNGKTGSLPRFAAPA